MLRAALFIAFLAVVAGCGSEDDEATTVSAAEVESAVMIQLSAGGGGIVRHDNEPPKQVTCVKDAGSLSGWRCTVKPSKGGESFLCMVEVDPQTKQTTKVTCARIDN